MNNENDTRTTVSEDDGLRHRKNAPIFRSNDADAEFTWRPDLTPEEARGRMRKLGIPEHLLSPNRR